MGEGEGEREWHGCVPWREGGIERVAGDCPILLGLKEFYGWSLSFVFRDN